MSRLRTALEGVRMLALAVWLGGLVALGAIAAPLVFHHVPAPFSADAMTLVFRRFDRFAVGSGVVILLCEGGLSWLQTRASRTDLMRMAVVVAATLVASVEAVWLSPAISDLHAAGAVRGVGHTGMQLEWFHRWAERLAKGELVLLVAMTFLIVVAGRASSDRVHSTG